MDVTLLLPTSDDFFYPPCYILMFVDHAKPSRNFLEYSRVPWKALKIVLMTTTVKYDGSAIFGNLKKFGNTLVF